MEVTEWRELVRKEKAEPKDKGPTLSKNRDKERKHGERRITSEFCLE